MNLSPLTGLASMAAPTSASSAPRDALQMRLDAKIKESQSALETLKQRPASANEDQKALARQKVEELKARIRMLKMSMPSDPKAAARMAAQLARELGAAVKAYAAAGGSLAGMGAEVPTATPAASADAPVDVEAAAQGASTNVEAPTAPTESSKADEDGSDTAGTSPDDQGRPRDDPYRQVVSAQQAQAAARAREGADKQADADFMTEVKKLANDIKSLLRQAAQAAKRHGESKDLPATDEREAEMAMAAMDRAIADAAQAMGGGVSLIV